MAVRGDHAAVKSEIPRRSGRNDLQFRREEIIFFDIVFLLQDRENILLDRILPVRFFCLLVKNHRLRSDQDVQVFSLDRFAEVLRHLVL